MHPWLMTKKLSTTYEWRFVMIYRSHFNRRKDELDEAGSPSGMV